MAKQFGGRWEVLESVDEGGQAFIYKVRDLKSAEEQVFALKRLKNLNRLDRFQKEIEACTKLQHPGIAPVLDFSLDDTPFFVTTLYEGSTLAAHKPMPAHKAIDMFLSLCDIVHYAHSQGVIHRDIKPDNIFITEKGKPVILDFGLCYFQEDDKRFTASMEQVGSRFYMAPELEAGKAESVKDKVDSYALGKVLYFMLSGRHVARESYTGDAELSVMLNNPQLRYMTEKILAVSIVEDPAKRSNVSSLRANALLVKRLLEEHFYPGQEGSICRFCGEGHYKMFSDRAGIRVHHPGVERTDIFALLVCDQCGNIQWFKRK